MSGCHLITRRPPSPTTPAAFPTSSLPRGGPAQQAALPFNDGETEDVSSSRKCLLKESLFEFSTDPSVLAIVCNLRVFVPAASVYRAWELWLRARLDSDPATVRIVVRRAVTVLLFSFLPPHPPLPGRAEEAWQTGGGWIERSRTNKGEVGARRWVMLEWEEEEGEKDAGMENGRENLGESSKQKTVTGIKGQHAEQQWRLNEWQQLQENIKK